MLVFAGKIGDFVDRHPTVKILALAFLLLIGVMLGRRVRAAHLQGLHLLCHGVALLVELLNMRLRKCTSRAPACRRARSSAQRIDPVINALNAYLRRMESNWKKKARSALLGLACSPAGLHRCRRGGGRGGHRIYLTTRGAESIVDGSIDDVERRARAVFEAESMPISGTQTENSGDKRELKGKKMTSTSPSRWSARARRPPRWRSPRGGTRHLDKDYAQQLLSKIVKQK